jgi:peptide/nickel transport system permease protein
MRFRRYALERIGATVAVLCLGLVGVFLICHVIGPMTLQGGGDVDPGVRARYFAYAHESFGDFLWRIFGERSLAQSLYGPEAAVAVPEASLVTLSLVGWAIFIGLLFAVPLGVLWERRPRGTRLVAAPFVYLAASLLPVWVALELSLYLGFRWEIVPVAGYADFFSPRQGVPGGPWEWAYHLILPAFVLALPFMAIYTRVIRAMLRDVRRARGASSPDDKERAVVAARHTGLITGSKGLLRDVGYLMGAALFIEVAFSLPGLGSSLYLATFASDTPLVEAVLIFGTFVAVAIHLLGNLVGAAVSRQWRLGS